jgi:3-hydroxyacyl-CoA dehydrogenase
MRPPRCDFRAIQGQPAQRERDTFVGLDAREKIGGIVFDKGKRYASPPLLTRMVSLGCFGRKSGKGFYDDSGEKRSPCRWCNRRIGWMMTKGAAGCGALLFACNVRCSSRTVLAWHSAAQGPPPPH